MNHPESLELPAQSKALFVPADRALAQACRTLLASVGEEPSREGLERTPQRFAKAIRELCSGYTKTLADAVGEGVFAAEGAGLVAVRDVEFHSLCEHHVLPFWGRASIAYYPSGKILGLSKLPRIVDCYAKRLQVQERLTRQVAEAVREVIAPRAVAVRVVAEHMCMRMRGVEKTHGDTASEFLFADASVTPEERQRLWAAIT